MQMPFLQKIENDAYYRLRHPDIINTTAALKIDNGDYEYRKKFLSTEHFLGYYQGKLDVIEDIRSMLIDGVVKHRKKLDNERKKLLEKK